MGDWKTAMKEADATLAAGADSSPQVKTENTTLKVLVSD